MYIESLIGVLRVGIIWRDIGVLQGYSIGLKQGVLEGCPGIHTSGAVRGICRDTKGFGMPTGTSNQRRDGICRAA